LRSGDWKEGRRISLLLIRLILFSTSLERGREEERTRRNSDKMADESLALLRYQERNWDLISGSLRCGEVDHLIQLDLVREGWKLIGNSLCFGQILLSKSLPLVPFAQKSSISFQDASIFITMSKMVSEQDKTKEGRTWYHEWHREKLIIDPKNCGRALQLWHLQQHWGEYIP
jgi:hypothetical protein